VVLSIHANGIALQWLADGMEHAHIEVIKDLSEFANNCDDAPQICQHLDHAEKCQQFNFTTAVCNAGMDFCARCSAAGPLDKDNDDCTSVASNKIVKTTTDLVNQINPVSAVSGKSLYSHVDYFVQAANLKNGSKSGQFLPLPFCTFFSPLAAFHLNCNPVYKCMLIDNVATLFKILDLHEALSDYMQHIDGANDRYIRTLGGCHSACLALLFTHLQVWKNFHLQNKAYHYPHETLPSKVVNACPSSGDWEWGQYNPVIANLDPACEWPNSSLKGLDVHI
jgi:hypothetical protein